MISTAEFRNGSPLMVEGQPFYIVEFQHVKPGKGGIRPDEAEELSVRQRPRPDLPFWRKVRNTPDRRMRHAVPLCHERLLHVHGHGNLRAVDLRKSQLGSNADLLKENMIAKILIYEHKPITVVLPNFIELKVVDGEPGVRGDTASGGSKPVTVETGATIKVPLYLEIGETIRIDTRTREFVERVR